MRHDRMYFVFLLVAVLCLFSTLTYITNTCHRESPPQSAHVIEVTAQRCDCPAKNCTTRRTTTMDTLSYTKQYSAKNTSEPMWKLKWHKSLPVKTNCTVLPSTLIGRFNITNTVTEAEVTNEKVTQTVKYGGVYRPPDCISDQTVAIIIPYRDREKHLNILVNLLHNILQRQKQHYGIYVVEMALPIQFNRGLLANAGFLTAHDIGNYTCYIIHDVDLIPINDRNIYKCGKSPRHLSASNSKFPHGLPYPEYVGGVLALTYDQFHKLNGFSNLFFGWGGEDDDMYKRMEACNMTLDRPETHIGTYLALPHSADSSNPPNPYREALMSQSKLRKDVDGISSIRFHRQTIEFRPLYTWVLVKCVESETMQNYAHLQVIYEKVIKRQKKVENHLVIMHKGEREPKPVQ